MVRRRPSLILSWFLGGAVLVSCGDPTEPEPEPQSPGELAVSVVVEGEGFGELQIRVAGPENRVVTTNAAGEAEFEGLVPGEYAVTITIPPTAVEFSETTLSVTVPSGGAATTRFEGRWKPSSLVGVVKMEGEPMPGETVELFGPVLRITNTNLSGHFEFADLPPGEYTLDLLGLGSWEYDFPERSATVTITRGETTTVNFFGARLPGGVITGQAFLDQDGDHVFDPGEQLLMAKELSVELAPIGSGGSVGDTGDYLAPRVRPGGPYTLWLQRFPEDNPWGIVSSEYAIDPSHAGHRNVFVENGDTLTIDLPVVPGVQKEIWRSGMTLSLSRGVTLEIPAAFSETTVVSLIPSSVTVEDDDIPTIGIHSYAVAPSEDVTLRFSAPASAPYPSGSTVWQLDDQTGTYVPVATTLSDGGREAAVSLGEFGVYLVPFLADPGDWPDLDEWFLIEPGAETTPESPWES